MFAVKYSYDIQPILSAVKNSNWIVTNFQTKGDDIYNPANYLHKRKLENMQYEMRLDRNIYSYILSSFKSTQDNMHFRNAMALLNFCQMADIELNPTLAVYEGINYSPINADKAIDELELFHQINNSDPHETYRYAIGKASTFQKGQYSISDRDTLKSDLLKYDRLTEWNSLYLLLLKVVQISQDDSIKNKIVEFQKWAYEHYRLSAPVTIFASFLFSGNPPKRINKYRQKDTQIERRAALYNMTWDIYLINRYLRDWVAKDGKTQIIFATADIALQTFFRALVDLQAEQNTEILRQYLNPKDSERTISALNDTYPGVQRAYESKDWSPEYQQKSIADLEKRLFS